MSTIIIPAQQIKVELEDASVDLVCFEYAHGILNDRTRAGKLTGYVEAIYNRFQYLDEMRDALELWAAHVMALQG